MSNLYFPEAYIFDYITTQRSKTTGHFNVQIYFSIACKTARSKETTQSYFKFQVISL